MKSEKYGELTKCPKCLCEEFTVKYYGQRLMSSVVDYDKIEKDGDERLLNACNNCGYMEFTLPMDADKAAICVHI